MGRRVYHVVAKGTADHGGVGRYLSTLLSSWPAASRYRLRVIDPYGPLGLAGTPLFLAWACVRIAAGRAAGRIDLLHVHACSRGSFLRKGLITHLASRLGLPVVLHLHAPDFDDFERSLPSAGRRFVRGTLARTHRVIVLGRYWQRLATEHLRVPAERVTVLHSAVRGPDHVPIRAAGAPRLVFVGQLGERKGLPELLRALAVPDVRRLSWSARVLGGGDVERWRGDAARLGLGDRVTVEGWVPEARVRQVLAESTVFVLPSRAEGLSIALLEAMAFGLAVVTTAAGGAADVLVHEASALLVRPADADDLAFALVRVLASEPLRTSLQDGARRQYESAHDIADYCRTVERLYDETLGVPSAHPR